MLSTRPTILQLFGIVWLWMLCHFRDGCIKHSSHMTVSSGSFLKRLPDCRRKHKSRYHACISMQISTTKIVTVTIISIPTRGLKLKFSSLLLSSQSQEEGEATKYVLTNGAALSLESNPDSSDWCYISCRYRNSQSYIISSPQQYRSFLTLHE